MTATIGQPIVFNRLAVIGIGHIGSSVARAARTHGLVGELVAYDTDDATLARVRELAIADRTESDPSAAVEGADCVILCTPLGTYDAIARAIGPHLAAETIVTDVGSVKRGVLEVLRDAVPEGTPIVPGHPLAGTEHSGPDAGFVELFLGRWCILTPPEDADQTAVAKVSALWRGMGSMVEIMSVEHHDKVLAITSHLPHLIAYTIVGTAVDLGDDLKQEVIKFSAGGFRDFTRIAASNPVMWRDVFLTNKDAVLEIIQRFTEDLTALQRAIRRGDGETLEDLFKRTRDIRRSVIEAKQA